MQVAGLGLSVGSRDPREAMRKSPSMHTLFLHFMQAFMTQMAHAAFANGRAKIEERLARRLLMVHDRLDGNELSLTHEFVAAMLGVRRAGVTTTLQTLEAHGLVSTKRGLIVVENREGCSNLPAKSMEFPKASTVV